MNGNPHVASTRAEADHVDCLTIYSAWVQNVRHDMRCYDESHGDSCREEEGATALSVHRCLRMNHFFAHSLWDGVTCRSLLGRTIWNFHCIYRFLDSGERCSPTGFISRHNISHSSSVGCTQRILILRILRKRERRRFSRGMPGHRKDTEPWVATD